MENALLPFPFDSGTAAGTTKSDELVDVDGTILTGRDTRSAWLTLPYGETVHVNEDEAERRVFHYDRLRGMVTTNSATWFLLERDDWLFGPADDARRSLLVRWDG